jgi:hypothetical protein
MSGYKKQTICTGEDYGDRLVNFSLEKIPLQKASDSSKNNTGVTDLNKPLGFIPDSQQVANQPVGFVPDESPLKKGILENGRVVYANTKLPLTAQEIKATTNTTRNCPGFRGLCWGDNFKKLSGFTYVKTDPSYGGVKIYKRATDILEIGAAKLDMIVYGFWQDKLYSVKLFFSGYVNFNGLKNAAEKKFGSNYQPNRYIERYFWFNIPHTIISLEYNEIRKKGVMWLTSKELSKEAKEYSERKAREGAKTGF